MAMRVAAIPGDGIGVEVLPAAVEVLDAALAVSGERIEWTWLDWGCTYFVDNGQMMPSDGLDILARHDAIFLGAVGRPDVPDHESLWGLLIPIRRHFDQYVNLRPIKIFDGLIPRVTLPPGKTVDLVIVRGEHRGRVLRRRRTVRTWNRSRIRGAGEHLYASRRRAHREVRMRAGAHPARTRSRQRRSRTGIIHTMPFWDDVVAGIVATYPDVTCTSALVDALAADLVLRPHAHDVIVASNLFGDILSDIAAAVVGSIGIAPSANLNPERDHPSMFEPVHGSAPLIAGKGIANPIAAVWSGAMMLEHLGHGDTADLVMRAIAESLGAPGTRTADLDGTATTAQVRDFLVSRVGSTS